METARLTSDPKTMTINREEILRELKNIRHTAEKILKDIREIE